MTSIERRATRLVAGVAFLLLAAATAGAGGAGRSADEQLKLGYAAARRGYWQEALMRFEAANRLKPQQAKILNNIAVALEATGRYEEAGATYETAIRLAPGDRNLSKNYSLFKEFYESQVAPKPAEDERAGAGETSAGDTAPDEGGDDEGA